MINKNKIKHFIMQNTFADVRQKQLIPLVFHNETKAVFDNWINETASIGANNSLSQYNRFLLDRLSYDECAKISLDTLINKAITTLSYDMLSHGYNIILTSENIDLATETKDKLEQRIRDFNLNSLLQDLAVIAFRFGGAFVYFDVGGKIEYPISNTIECCYNNSLNSFLIIEPNVASASYVNTNNALKSDYMSPKQWFISSCGVVDSTRLMPLTFFEVPKIIKPLFNYLGISLTQLMKDYTQNAETIRQCLSELMLRFKTDYIKTASENIGDDEYMARIKFNNATKNNFSTLLLGENEELQTLTTTLSGIDNITSQAYELVVASSGIPATRLMGISPRGFNATGESDLQHYYETIAQHQTRIKPVLIECIKKILYFDLKIFHEFFIDIEFNPINYQTEKEKMEVHNLKADYYLKLSQGGIITEKEALESLQYNDPYFNNIDSEKRETENYLD